MGRIVLVDSVDVTGVDDVDALSLPFDLEKEPNQDDRLAGDGIGGSTRV